MTLLVNVRVWEPLVPVDNGKAPDGATFAQPAHYKGIGEADAGETGVSAYIDLDMDPNDPTRSFASLDLTGEKADFEHLIKDLQLLVAINFPDEPSETTTTVFFQPYVTAYLDEADKVTAMVFDGGWGGDSISGENADSEEITLTDDQYLSIAAGIKAARVEVQS